MNFTKEDLQRIAKGLKQLSIKDTQFANAKALTTETKFPVVQSSVNVLLTAAQLLNFLVGNLDANSLTINIPNWTSGTLSNLIGRLYTLVTAPRDADGNPITAETIEYSNTIDEEITSVANALDYVIDQLLDKIDAIEIAGEPRLDPTQMPIITLNNIIPTDTCPITVGSGMWFDENHILQYRDGNAVPPVDVEIGPPVDMLYYYDGNAYKYNMSMQAFVKVGAVDLSSYIREDSFTGRLSYDMMPWVVLKSMTIPNVQVLNTHKDFCYYNPYNRKVTFHKSDLTTSSYNPEDGIIYYDVSSGNFLIWNGGDANPWTVIGGTSSDSNKADLLTDTTMLRPTEWPKVVINNIDVYDDNDDQPGDVIYDYAHEKLVLFKGYDDNLEPVYVDMGRPQEGTVYCLKSTNALYRWENDTLQWIPITSGGGSADFSNYYTRGDVNSLLSTKVDKEPDKSLMMDAERIKLQGIAEGAEVNVQADWNQTTTTADDYIKNKPDLTQYQPVLTAGENITIATNPQTGNLEISASGGGSPASNKADILVGTTMLRPTEWPRVVINNIDAYDDNNDQPGDVIYDYNHEKLLLFDGYDDNLEPVYVDMGHPQEGTVYCLKSTNALYRWEFDTYQWIPVGGGSADLSNYYTKNDVDGFLLNKANDADVVKGINDSNGNTLPKSNGIVTLPPAGSTISPASNAPIMDGNTALVGSSAKYAREDHVHPHDTSKANASDVYLKSQTYNKDELDVMLDYIEAGDTVVINSDGANIVDEHDNNSVLLAPSARQMKLMYNNLMAIYNGLAGIAFTNGKPTLDWVGSKTKYTLSYGTLTGCTADVAAGQVNEGALRIKLTPTQASYAFTSVTVNGESASTTATGDADGSVYLDIIVNGNITVAATAISGRAVNFNGGDGATIGAAGVAIGQDLDTTITANEHFTLPASITVKIGNTNVAHTYTRAQDNKTATLHIDAANITGDLTITCTSVEDAHVTIAISGSNFVVKQGNAQLSNGSKVYNGRAVLMLVEPASGYKFSTLPSADKGTMTNNGPYEASSLVIGTSVSGTLTITAAGAALDTFSIDLSGLVGVTSSNAATSIQEGAPYSTTLSKTDASASGSVIVGTCTMGNETITANNNTISIGHVTGNIVLAASVGVGRTMVNSWGYIPTTDADGKHYIPDEVGDFWLYSRADAQPYLMYPTGSYGNMITGRDAPSNGVGGYGDHRNLGTTVNDNGTLKYKVDFTLRVKHLQAIPDGNGNLYNSIQTIIKCFYGGDVKWGTGFSLVLNASGNNTYGTQYMKLGYGNGNTALSAQFTEKGVTDATPYDYILSFVQDTMKATLYRVGQNGTVEKCGEQTLTAQLPLYAFIYIPDANNMQGLDLFNYAMTQQEVEDLYQNN